LTTRGAQAHTFAKVWIQYSQVSNSDCHSSKVSIYAQETSNVGIIAIILKLAQEKMNTSGEEKKKGARQSTTL
jgi:hypothetical protein